MLTQLCAGGGTTPPPPVRLSWVPAAILGCDGSPPRFALREGVKRYPGPQGP